MSTDPTMNPDPTMRSEPTVLVLHPGDMGAAIGTILRGKGLRVCWVSEGRSSESARRAAQAGLEAVPTLGAALASADIVLSVCPPHGAQALATEVATEVATTGFKGLYIDANAISPTRSLRIEEIVTSAGARFLDGGIIGPPPRGAATARLYLAGADAGWIAALFSAGALTGIALQGPAGQASALKMAYAAWNKGTIALLASLRALAAQQGIEAALLEEWRLTDADVLKRCDRVPSNAFKAWRWEAEMEEIADTFAQAGLPDGFHRSAAQVYARMHGFKDNVDAPTLAEVGDTLRRTR